MLSTDTLRRFDWILFLSALGLVAFGVAFIHSATYSSIIASEYRGGGLPVWSLRSFKQLVWGAMGLCACVLIVLVDYDIWRKWAYTLYAVGIVALVMLFAFGVTRGGSRRWFRAPGGFLLQPSEMMKVSFIVALACYLMFRKNYRRMPGLAIPFLLALCPVVLILRQPDMGTSMVFLPILFAMLYVAGARPRHLLAVVGAGLVCAPMLWIFVMSTRQKGRILAFLYPEKDPSGAGYHLLESLVAIGTGGLTGHGYARGPQNLLAKVPEAETDFIFSVIAEEWGFAGGAALVLLYLLLFWRMFEIGARTKEPFGRLVVVGCVTLLAFQTLVNIGMTVRLCPITGLTLPFVSYGGSSLLTNFIILGLVRGIGLRPRQVAAPDDFSVEEDDAS